jgi:succinate dehydrogenase / fumarate reductase flavoprotein subunit
MLTVAEAVARAGLLREESRGAHSRIDFPEYDEHWGGLNIVVRKGREGMELEPRPVRMRDELAGLVDRRKAAEAGDAVEVVAE